MATLARSVRFLVGVTMVGGGVALAAPLLMRLTGAAVAVLAERSSGGMETAPGTGIPAGSRSMPMAIHGHTFPQVAEERVTPPAAAAMPPAGPFSPAAEQQFPTAAFAQAAVEPAQVDSPGAAPLNAGYVPPTPPEPLPPQPLEIAQPGPDIGGAYRSTLNVPPPQLLDAQQPPPPTVAWTAREATRPPVPQAAPRTSFVPSKYRVRDGDDLAGIASRFYGHSAAATSIWAANRDVISDPGLLPIGAELTLPPAWAITQGRPESGPGSAIEPVGGSMPAGPLASGSPPAAAVHPWLAPDAGAQSAALQPVPAPAMPVQAAAFRPAGVQPPPSQRVQLPAQGGGPRTVRVAPGESLATIAQRFYGDAGMAPRIWEANRSRLRSPDLLVPGMELTLP